MDPYKEVYLSGLRDGANALRLMAMTCRDVIDNNTAKALNALAAAIHQTVLEISQMEKLKEEDSATWN